MLLAIISSYRRMESLIRTDEGRKRLITDMDQDKNRIYLLADEQLRNEQEEMKY